MFEERVRLCEVRPAPLRVAPAPGQGPGRAVMEDAAGSASEGTSTGRDLQHGSRQRLPAELRGALQRTLRRASSKDPEPTPLADRASISLVGFSRPSRSFR